MAEANLLQAAWLRVRRAGGPALVKPHELPGNLSSDPILDLNWPRADFRIACLELLVGRLCCKVYA
jgi:CRISPR system Cascade subunit CasA